MQPYRLGYVANCLTLGIGASHTTRLANATPERLEALIEQNLEELERILLFNEAHGIEVYRITSSLVPFASHAINRLEWWKTFRRQFERCGAIAIRSHQRLSLHPSPAGASLASARAEVRAAAVEELRYGTRVLDLLGQDANGRIVLHLGGAAPDRATALASAHRFLGGMPDDARRRLAIEHDCRVWSALEVHPLAKANRLPFLADNLHNNVKPSEPPLTTRELFRLSAATWRELGLRPKYHLASQKPGGRTGAHADFIAPEDWYDVVSALEEPADFMLEAKEKDRALFALRALIAGEAGAGAPAP